MSDRLVSPIVSDEEQVIEGSLRPRRLAEYIGQEKIKANLSVLLEAARRRGESVDHVLLYGPPGLGKTTLCNIIAVEMGVNLKTTSGPAIEHAGDLASILTSLQSGEVLFIDEIHRLARAVEERLYSAMEDFALDVMIGKGPGARALRLEFPDLTEFLWGKSFWAEGYFAETVGQAEEEVVREYIRNQSQPHSTRSPSTRSPSIRSARFRLAKKFSP